MKQGHVEEGFQEAGEAVVPEKAVKELANPSLENECEEKKKVEEKKKKEETGERPPIVILLNNELGHKKVEEEKKKEEAKMTTMACYGERDSSDSEVEFGIRFSLLICHLS